MMRVELVTSEGLGRFDAGAAVHRTLQPADLGRKGLRLQHGDARSECGELAERLLHSVVELIGLHFHALQLVLHAQLDGQTLLELALVLHLRACTAVRVSRCQGRRGHD